MAGYLDNCGFVAASSGTVDFVVSSALSGGYQLPAAAGVAVGAVYYYRAYSSDQTQWEIGLAGAYTATGGGTFPRPTAVLFNSLGTTAKISFSNPPNVVPGVLLAEGLAVFNAAFVAYRFLYSASNTFSGADQNSLTLQYTPGAVLAMRNGRMLTPGLDFTATNGSSITINVPLVTNDEIDFIAFTTALAASYNTIQQWTKTATAGQTVFTGLDDTGLITLATNGFATQVFTSGGGILTPTADYTLTSTTITLVSGLPAGQTLSSVTINTNNLTGVTQPQNTNDTTMASTAYADRLAPRGWIDGLTLSTAGSSTTFGVAAGQARNSTNTWMMALASAFTKTTSAWALGTGNGALDTGSIANNTWYHVYLIARPDTGVVDVLLSLSATAPTLPTNYTLFRRIGSMLTSGSAQWSQFFQNGDEFIWTTAVGDVAVSNLGTTATLYTLTVPTGVIVKALFNAGASLGSGPVNTIYSSPTYQTDAAPNSPTGNTSATSQVTGVYSLQQNPGIWTNTSAQIRARSTATSTNLLIATFGWIDQRGRNA